MFHLNCCVFRDSRPADDQEFPKWFCDMVASWMYGHHVNGLFFTFEEVSEDEQ